MKSQRLRKIAWTLAPIGALAAIVFCSRLWSNWRPAILEPETTAIYRQTNGVWQRAPELPGRADSLRSSSNGTLWALTNLHEGGDAFARLDGGSWRIYRAKDTGLKNMWISGYDFALDGEEIWAASYKAVLHWDGRRWQTYPDVHASVIAASGGRAWALDEKGRLSQFEAGQWKALEVEPPAEDWDQERYWPGHLVRTGDGALWFARNRLWRSDCKTWREIKVDSDFPRMLGVSGDRVWVWDGRRVRSISADGEEQIEYRARQTGLEPGEENVYQAVSRNGVTYLATERGVVQFDGTNWTRLAAMGFGVRTVRGIALGSAGELWAIGVTPNPAYRYTRLISIFVPLAMGLAALAIPIWMVRRAKREKLAESQRVRQAVELATGAAPEQFERVERRLTRESTWLGASVSVMLPLVSLIAYAILGVFWRKAPTWTFLALAIVFHGLHVLWKSLLKRTPKPWDPIQPGGPGYDWSEVRKVLPGTLGIFLLMNFDVIQRYFGDPIVWVLGGLAAWFLYQGLTGHFLSRALKNAEYDEAGKVVLKFRFHSPDGARSLRLRALALLLAGRYREAEEVSRRAVAETRNSGEQAYCLEHLGNALMEQGRYEEAQRSLEAAVHARPGFRRAYRGMAEILLRQHKDPQRALEYVEQIVGASGPSWNRLGINGEVRDDYWALKAWALAELGRSEEVAGAIENAIRLTSVKDKPSAAMMYYRVGMAMQAIGNDARSAEYFERVRQADPEGRAGKLARAALGERPVFRT